MLSMFTIKHHYCGIDVSIHVDCERKEASALIKHEKRIVWNGDVAFWEVQSPEHCERWLSRPIGETGSFMEDLHWQARRGIGIFARQPVDG